MPELERTLRKIEETKRKGESRLRIIGALKAETVATLRDMGYLVLQIYTCGRIDTIVGLSKYG